MYILYIIIFYIIYMYYIYVTARISMYACIQYAAYFLQKNINLSLKETWELFPVEIYPIYLYTDSTDDLIHTCFC